MNVVVSAYSLDSLEGVHELDIYRCLVVSPLSLILQACGAITLLLAVTLIEVEEVVELVPDLLPACLFLFPCSAGATLAPVSLPLHVLPETLTR
jgi:hypothetical protein